MVQSAMGDYEVVSDTRTRECSLRLLRIDKGKPVMPHYHTSTSQIYVVLTGSVQVRLGEGVRPARPFESIHIPPLTVHGLESEAPALALSISVPPLDLNDQHSVGTLVKAEPGWTQNVE